MNINKYSIFGKAKLLLIGLLLATNMMSSSVYASPEDASLRPQSHAFIENINTQKSEINKKYDTQREVAVKDYRTRVMECEATLKELKDRKFSQFTAPRNALTMQNALNKENNTLNLPTTDQEKLLDQQILAQQTRLATVERDSGAQFSMQVKNIEKQRKADLDKLDKKTGRLHIQTAQVLSSLSSGTDNNTSHDTGLMDLDIITTVMKYGTQKEQNKLFSYQDKPTNTAYTPNFEKISSTFRNVVMNMPDPLPNDVVIPNVDPSVEYQYYSTQYKLLVKKMMETGEAWSKEEKELYNQYLTKAQDAKKKISTAKTHAEMSRLDHNAIRVDLVGDQDGNYVSIEHIEEFKTLPDGSNLPPDPSKLIIKAENDNTKRVAAKYLNNIATSLEQQAAQDNTVLDLDTLQLIQEYHQMAQGISKQKPKKSVSLDDIVEMTSEDHEGNEHAITDTVDPSNACDASVPTTFHHTANLQQAPLLEYGLRSTINGLVIDLSDVVQIIPNNDQSTGCAIIGSEENSSGNERDTEEVNEYNNLVTQYRSVSSSDNESVSSNRSMDGERYTSSISSNGLSYEVDSNNTSSNNTAVTLYETPGASHYLDLTTNQEFNIDDMDGYYLGNDSILSSDNTGVVNVKNSVVYFDNIGYDVQVDKVQSLKSFDVRDNSDVFVNHVMANTFNISNTSSVEINGTLVAGNMNLCNYAKLSTHQNAYINRATLRNSIYTGSGNLNINTLDMMQSNADISGNILNNGKDSLVRIHDSVMHLGSLGRQDSLFANLVMTGNSRVFVGHELHLDRGFIGDGSRLEVQGLSSFNHLIVDDKGVIYLDYDIINPDTAKITAHNPYSGLVVITRNDIPAIGTAENPMSEIQLKNTSYNGYNKKMHNDIYAEDIHLFSGAYDGTYTDEFFDDLFSDMNRNTYSMNAKHIIIPKNQAVELNNLALNSDKMYIKNGSMVWFNNIKNNVKHIYLGHNSFTEFFNNDKNIQIPKIHTSTRNNGTVYIQGGTVNGIGAQNMPVESVVFWENGQNIIAGNIYAQDVQFYYNINIEASNAGVAIQVSDQFYGVLPTNWDLSDDGKTLTPEAGALVGVVAVGANANNVALQQYNVAGGGGAAVIVGANGQVADRYAQENGAAITVQYDNTADAAANARAEEERYAQEVATALYTELAGHNSVSGRSEYSSQAQDAARAVVTGASEYVQDYDSAAEYGNKIIREYNLNEKDRREYIDNSYDDGHVALLNNDQKKMLLAVAYASEDQDSVGVTKKEVPNVNTNTMLRAANDIITSDILARIADMMEDNMTQLSENNLSDEIGVSSGDDDLKRTYGLWVKGVYGKAKQGKTQKQAAYDSNTYGVVIGADVEFDGLMVVGAAYNPMKTDFKYAKNNKGDKLSADSHLLSLYMSNYLNDKMSLRTIISGGITDIKSKRKVGKHKIATGKMSNKFYSAQSVIDYKIERGNVYFIPQAGLKYSNFHDTAFKEKGAGLHNINIKGKNYNELSAIGGMKVALRPRKLSDGIILNSSMHAYVEQVLTNSKYNKQIKFAWADEYFKNEIGDKNKRNYNIGGNIGVAYKNFELSTGYNLYLRRKYKGHQASIKLDVKL